MAQIKDRKKPSIPNEWKAQVRVRVSYSYDQTIDSMFLDEGQDELDAHDAAIEWAEGDAAGLNPENLDTAITTKVDDFDVEVEVIDVECVSDYDASLAEVLEDRGEVDGFGLTTLRAWGDD